jgi:hypothetical protein
MNTLTPETTPKAARKLLGRLARDKVNYRDFLRLRVADRAANRAKPPYTVTQIKTLLGILEREAFPEARERAVTVQDLAVSGHDVMAELDLRSGAEVGRVLHMLLERVMEQPELNTREQLLRIMREQS